MLLEARRGPTEGPAESSSMVQQTKMQNAFSELKQDGSEEGGRNTKRAEKRVLWRI